MDLIRLPLKVLQKIIIHQNNFIAQIIIVYVQSINHQK